MGLWIPPGMWAGNHCQHGDPELWATNEAPRWVKCQFWGIIDCGFGPPTAINTLFILEQVPGFPCLWEYDDGTYHVYWYLEAARSTLVQHVSPSPATYWFADQPLLKAQTNFVNDAPGCDPVIWWGRSGTATISWP